MSNTSHSSSFPGSITDRMGGWPNERRMSEKTFRRLRMRIVPTVTLQKPSFPAFLVTLSLSSIARPILSAEMPPRRTPAVARGDIFRIIERSKQGDHFA